MTTYIRYIPYCPNIDEPLDFKNKFYCMYDKPPDVPYYEITIYVKRFEHRFSHERREDAGGNPSKDSGDGV